MWARWNPGFFIQIDENQLHAMDGLIFQPRGRREPFRKFGLCAGGPRCGAGLPASLSQGTVSSDGMPH
jgi:hypothetical protein